MTQLYRIRDPVHNFVTLRENEVKLLATPLLQRLRGIRQLAMAHLVYPGAFHTRFDHSLGVCHVAGMMAESLCLSDEDTRLVRLAALLHDLGHGPFSHVSEYVLERYANRSALPAAQKKEKIHELVSARLILYDQHIGRLVAQEDLRNIVRLLSCGYGAPVLRAIVSGPVDADKQDYLLRDSYFCGVKYGVFDLYQLHRSFVSQGPAHDEEFMVSEDGVHTLEQFVLAKYYLTTNVYRHRVRLITDQMIVRALTLGIDTDQLDSLRELYSFDNSPAFFDRYLRYDDARLLHEFDSLAKPNTRCGNLLTRLQARRLHKRVFSLRLDKFSDPAGRELLQDIGKPRHATLRGRMEARITEVINRKAGRDIDSSYTILHAFDIKSVRTTARNDEGDVMVFGREGPRAFDQVSTLFRSINDQYGDSFVEVYAPMDWDNRTDRGRILDALKEPIQDALEEMAREYTTTETPDGHA